MIADTHRKRIPARRFSQEVIEGGAGKKLRNLFPTRSAEFLLYEKSV
jgi:hypothetical protein